MATRLPQQVTSTGLDPTAHPATETGDKVRPGSIVQVDNGSGGSLTVTMVTPSTYDGLAISDRTYTIANGASWTFLASEAYRSKTDQLIKLTYSEHTGVTLKVFKA